MQGRAGCLAPRWLQSQAHCRVALPQGTALSEPLVTNGSHRVMWVCGSSSDSEETSTGEAVGWGWGQMGRLRGRQGLGRAGTQLGGAAGCRGLFWAAASS